MAIAYRVAEMRDLEELVRLRCRFLEEAHGEPLEPKLCEAIGLMLLKLMPAGDVVSWLAEADGRIVGTGCIVFYERLPNRSSPDGRCGYIQSMYTEPEYRGRGIGSAIFAKLIEEAKTRGVRAVSLHALPAGAGVYKKAGFVFTTDEMAIRL